MPQRRNPRILDLTSELVASIECPLPNRDDESGKARLSEAEYEHHARALLDQGPDGPIWLFAYGSLIWNPAFEHDHHVIATVHGYRRSFCMDLTGWRATPEQPGLMMALDRGGACTGLAYRLTPGDRQAQMVRLLQREVPFADGLPWVRWLNARAKGDTFRALVFYAAPRVDPGRYLIRLGEAEQADRLAIACGHMGSCAAYLMNTVQHLEQAGIHDAYLWRLQGMVADRIRSAPLAAPPATG
ncbi:MAG: gamma-glutamylcyclotransferase [Paracoccaceae bacterium]